MLFKHFDCYAATLIDIQKKRSGQSTKHHKNCSCLINSSGGNLAVHAPLLFWKECAPVYYPPAQFKDAGIQCPGKPIKYCQRWPVIKFLLWGEIACQTIQIMRHVVIIDYNTNAVGR